MTRFSANLGFLWADRPLPEAIRAAKTAGFDAVECHCPYATPPTEVRAALAETGLPMISLNTRRGEAGEMGLAALPGRGAEARETVDEALSYARAVGAAKIHVLAGRAEGPDATAAFRATLTHACAEAAPDGIGILIEPLNRYDAPGYFLKTTDEARAVIEAVGAPNLGLMFDCYHVQIMEGDVTRRLRALLPVIGHIQFASVPDRGPPDRGELDFGHVFGVIRDLGYDAPLGAEYRPAGDTDATLGWIRRFRG